MMQEKLVVDCAYDLEEYPGEILVKIEGEYYLLPAMNRSCNDLAAFKKMPKELVKHMKKHPFPNYRYINKDLEKKSGYNIKVGRAISEKEFDDLKKELGLTENDISEPFETKRGAIYGEKYAKKFTCVQIRVNEIEVVTIEKKLRKKGIEAENGCSGRIDIRVPA